MAFKDTWKDLVDNVDDIEVKPINDIAHGVIENEENKLGKETSKGSLRAYGVDNEGNQTMISTTTSGEKNALLLTDENGNSSVADPIEDTHIANKKFVDEENTKQNNIFANALKGKASGAIVSMDDVSPLEHKIPVRLESENLIPYPYIDTTKTVNGITFTDNGDGSITVNGTATSMVIFDLSKLYNLSEGQYVLSGATTGTLIELYKNGVWETQGTSTSSPVIRLEDGDKITGLTITIIKGQTINNLTVYPKLQKGTVATPYTPFVPNDTAVTVKSCGKNHLPNDIYDFNNWIVQSGLQKIYPFNNLVVGQTYTFSFKVLQNLANFGYFYLNKKKGEMTESLARFAAGGVMTSTSHSFVIEEGVEYYLYGWFQYADSGAFGAIADIQLELGSTATPYEPYKEGETITTTLAEGAEVKSIALNMTITTDKSGVVIDTEYNKDSNIVIEKLTQAIISLGGNI